MATEDHNGGRSPSDSPTKVAHSFDDLARALAEGSISRRRALKLFAGSALAALIPSRALARQQKVTICHKPGTPDQKTMEVPQSAVDGHLGHGDTLGSCKTTTTSTTETPTTTTSTSTTSTSTTPMCIANGGTCTPQTASQCCSGNCKSGTCVESCIPPNAKVCDPNNSSAVCTCTSQFSGCVPESGGESYCRSGADTTRECFSSCDCPTGQFCHPAGDTGLCAVAC